MSSYEAQIPATNPNEAHRLVICIGDIHGYYTKLKSIWSNLQSAIDPSQFSRALIIFLGNYCDRGPDTKGVIDFHISLPSKYPNQTHVFLSDNHDFAFAAFLGAIPSPPDGITFRDTWREFEAGEEKEGWYKGEGYEKMHLLGIGCMNRWGVAKGVAGHRCYDMKASGGKPKAL